MNESDRTSAHRPERRERLALRALIDEMLQRVREIHRKGAEWDPAERARAEAELETIMARVRRETVRETPAATPAIGENPEG